MFFPSFAEHSGVHLACQQTATSRDDWITEKLFWALDVRWMWSELMPKKKKKATFKNPVLLFSKNIFLFSLNTLAIYADNLREFCHFCFSASFEWGLCCPSLLSTSYFKWSVLWQKTGFHTHCQSLFLLIPPYLYFQLFLFFCHTSFGCADIDANTMCLFISLSRAWGTFLYPSNEKKKPRQRSDIAMAKVS